MKTLSTINNIIFNNVKFENFNFLLLLGPIWSRKLNVLQHLMKIDTMNNQITLLQSYIMVTEIKIFKFHLH